MKHNWVVNACTISLAFREMQIRTSYHVFNPLNYQKLKSLLMSDVGEDVKGALMYCVGM